MVILKNALMCMKKVILINYDCLPILMLLYIMLYIVLAYLMLFASTSNTVCLVNVFFLPFIFANASCFRALSWVIVTVYLSQILFCIMHSAFNLLVFIILCSHDKKERKGYVHSGEIALKNNHYYYYLIVSDIMSLI